MSYLWVVETKQENTWFPARVTHSRASARTIEANMYKAHPVAKLRIKVYNRDIDSKG